MLLMIAPDADAWQRATALVYLLTTLPATCGTLLAIRYVWSRTLSMCTCALAILAALPLLHAVPWEWTATSVCVLVGTVWLALAQLRGMEWQERRCFASTYGGLAHT